MFMMHWKFLDFLLLLLAQHVLSLLASSAIIQAPLAAQDFVKVTFESAEHSFIGNLVTLQYPDRKIDGKESRFKIGDRLVSYGMIVALAGDYFGDWTLTGCPPSISDGWDNDPESSIKRFEKMARSMTEAKPELVHCILDALGDLDNQLCEAYIEGHDPAQSYSKISDYYNNQFALCPGSGYLHLSLCNWDHFGEDAIKAYKAGHTAALLQASKASKDKNTKGLENAYYLEAYAQHFLTDLFSAGHLRTPRRQLHRQAQLGDDINKWWPADQACKMQHDEDCAGGLWVANALGEKWTVYGDKDLPSAKSYANLDQTVAAVQAGLDEIWNAFISGDMTSTADFKGLKKIPLLANFAATENFTPMFSSKSSDLLSRRENLDDRSSRPTHDLQLSAMDHKGWSSELDKIERSGPKESAAISPPATIDGLLPEVNLTQIQSRADQGFVVNRYGPLLSHNYRRQSLNFCNKKVTERGTERKSWNMLSQDLIDIPKELASMSWHSAKHLESGVIALEGSRLPETSESPAVLLGIKGNTLVWTQEYDLGHADMSPVKLLYGHFCSDSELSALIQQQDNSHSSHFTLRVFTAGAGKAPAGENLSWTIPKAQNTFAYQQSGTTGQTFVSAAHVPDNQTYVWTVVSWASEYKTHTSLTMIETGIPTPAQQILLHDGKFVRVTPTSSNTLKIEVLALNTSSSQVRILTSQDFPVTWDLKSVYRKMFLRYIAGSGPGLVMLLSQEDTHTLTTLVFPPTQDGGFAAPVSTLIQAPRNIREFTTSYLKSIQVEKVGYRYRDGKTTDGAIMQLFDNYGILGARLLVPKQGNGIEKLQYEVRGQVPAIAGQRSEGIGWVFET